MDREGSRGRLLSFLITERFPQVRSVIIALSAVVASLVPLANHSVAGENNPKHGAPEGLGKIPGVCAFVFRRSRRKNRATYVRLGFNGNSSMENRSFFSICASDSNHKLTNPPRPARRSFSLRQDEIRREDSDLVPLRHAQRRRPRELHQPPGPFRPV